MGGLDQPIYIKYRHKYIELLYERENFKQLFSECQGYKDNI